MGKLTKGKGILGVLLTALMVCTLLVSVTPALANPDSGMSVSPDTQTVNPGDTFDVTIMVSADVASRGAQCYMSFDAGLVEFVSVDEGTFYSDWATTHSGSTFFNNFNNQGQGTVGDLSCSILGGDSGGPTGTGSFAVIHMQAKTGVSGASPLTLLGVEVIDDQGNEIAGLVINNGEVVVGASGTAPTVTTNAATGVGDEVATLNGTLDNLGTASSVDVSFEWGTSTAYGDETTSETMTSTGAFSAALSGLIPGTTYHFKAKAVGEGTSYGSDTTFVTTGETPSSTILTATILPAVSIIVDPTSIDFGELVAGDISDPHTITITNLGGKSVDVTADATADSLYVDGLWLDIALWDVYGATIAKGGNTTTDAALHVGATYAGLGTVEGTLIFWAEVTP